MNRMVIFIHVYEYHGFNRLQIHVHGNNIKMIYYMVIYGLIGEYHGYGYLWLYMVEWYSSNSVIYIYICIYG